MPKLRELFESAYEIEPPLRAAWLDRHCADAGVRMQLQRMLQVGPGDHAAPPFDELIEAIGVAEPADMPAPGGRVGPFTLIEQIGDGGSSIVFRAEREQSGVRQVVALKLLRYALIGPDERHRFRTERLALSRLRHPAIARLVEGGISDEGIAYIALELVDGVSITTYVRQAQLHFPARLRLFVEACRAVEAAHRALIVHRDLKPSNVLVTAEGHVKLLDFGIAKLLAPDADVDGERTRTQRRSMTPAYAAPEQIEGAPVTTATDVYALGVLLEELVTGHRRRQGDTTTPSSQVAAVADPGTLPAPAAQTRRQLRGDFDNIVLKATQADPNQRYASAGALADDLTRLLDGQPVAAHPPSRTYRARKFVQRHRATVAGGAVLALAVLAALGVAVWEARVARSQARRAEAVQGFIVDLLGAAATNIPREQRPTPRQVVELALKRIDADRSLSTATRSDILRTLGKVTNSFGDYERAATLFAQALALRQALDAADSDSVLELQAALAQSQSRAGRNDEAAALLAPVYATLLHKDDAVAAEALKVYADIEDQRGDEGHALALGRTAYEMAARALDPDSREAIETQLWFGEQFTGTRSNEAIAILEPAIAHWRRAGLPEEMRLAHAIGALAVARTGQSDLDRAEADYRDAIASYRRIVDGPHDQLAWQLEGLGSLLANEARFDEAEKLLREANAMEREVVGADAKPVAYSTNFLGVLELGRRRFDAAEGYAREVAAQCARVPLQGEPCPDARYTLTQALLETGRVDEAAVVIDEAIRLREASFGRTHPAVGPLLVGRAMVRVAQQRYADALDDSDRAIALCGDAVPLARIKAGWLRAQALRGLERPVEALAQVTESSQQLAKYSPHYDHRLVPMLALQAELAESLGKHDDARRIAKSALDMRVPEPIESEEVIQVLHALGGT